MRASTESGRAVDAQTAELLAAQQAQLSVANEQLRSLGRNSGSWRAAAVAATMTFRDRSSARAIRSPRFGVGESAGSGLTNARGNRVAVLSGVLLGHSKRSSAATNTVWRREAGVKASGGSGMRGTGDRPPSPIEEDGRRTRLGTRGRAEGRAM